jgi:hypothetical protein
MKNYKNVEAGDSLDSINIHLRKVDFVLHARKIGLMPIKPPQRKKQMTIEDLAGSIQRDFVAIREDLRGVRREVSDMRDETATRQEIADLREEVTSRFATRSEIQSVVASAKDEIIEEIGKIKYAKEIDELRDRVENLERQLGGGRARRSA